MSGAWRWALVPAGAVLLTATLPAREAPLAVRLADLGPRPVGSQAHDQAADLLLAALREAGLQRVEALTFEVPLAAADSDVLEVPGDSGLKRATRSNALILRNLTGVLPGRGKGEILLSAHYDTVPKSPGAGDDASGCGAIVGAIADLARTPLRRSVRVMLFDGEEAGLLGSKAWTDSLSAWEKEQLLAAINVEGVGWAGSAGPVIHSFPVRRLERRRLAPGWLVHATLRGGAAADWPLGVVDPWISIPAQLLVRSSKVRFGADSDSLLAAGVPALFVSDGSFVTFDPAYHGPADRSQRLDPARLERWSQAIAAVVRRLDGLAGRPADEDQYLAAFGRVWLRRDLVWLCFATWILLALVAWRRGRSPEARPLGLDLAFRTLLLLAALVIPVFAATLLLPAALAGLATPRRGLHRAVVLAIGLLPATALVALYLLARARHFVGAWELGWSATALLAATLCCFILLALRPPRRP